jgi:hypothetical protein
MDKQAEIARIKAEYEARNKEIDRQSRNANLRIGGGAILQGISALPIFNIPYVGTGLGGALFEAGNAIMEGKSGEDIKNDAGRGFLIGEAVGFLPPVVQKLSKTKAGQAVGNQASKLYNYLADTKVGQKVAEIAPKVEDALMTDIKAFNPFKKTQTVYHGSPADFKKFSNEAIGSGEGNQVHGYGHYAAKSKKIADERYRKRLSSGDYEIAGQKLDDPYQEATLRDVMSKGKSNVMAKYEKDLLESKKIIDDFESKYTQNELFKNDDLYLPYDNARDRYMNTLERYDFIKNIDENSITKNEGQLYKLLIPEEDVMLKEELLFKNQSPKVQQALKNLYEENYNKYPHNSDLMQILYTDNMAQKYANNYGYKEGKSIYDAITDMTGSAEEASNLLNKYGVKGISYDGAVDGQSNVVFDPNNIEIVRKYFNQPELWNKFKGAIPNQGAGLLAIEDALRNFKFQRGSEEEKMYKSLGNNYRKNVLQHAPIYIPNEGIFEFTAHNAKKDLPLNYKQYPDIRQQILTSQKGFPTNTKGEKDRYYKHFLNTYNGDYYDYIFEALNDNRNVYKMTRKKGTSIVPYKKNTEVIPYDGQLTPSTERSLYNYIINNF